MAARLKAPVREGSTLSRAPANDALYVADEDHGAVRRVALPLDPSAPTILDIPMPGPVWVDRSSMEIEKVAFTPRGVDVIFPVRRGDARYFELFEWVADYMYPSGHAVGASISESWVEGEPAPVLTM